MTYKEIEFIIDHIDPLGQGVYKKDDQIFFIPKTLPGERGVARVYKSKKNIHFASPISIAEKSDQREEALCPHYNQCNGCHYLHTDYDNELEFKRQSFLRMASYDFDIKKIDTHPAPRRFEYRNRIQLHYNLKSKSIGFINPSNKRIINVSQCMMPTSPLKEKLDNFLKTWHQEAQKHANRQNVGHVELYLRDNELTTSWNQRYSQGGFTQVFKEMNDVLGKIVSSQLSKDALTLDLFGGDGNLSKQCSNRIIVDYYGEKEIQDNQIHLDLFDPKSLVKFKRSYSQQIDTLIIDPPRKGFPLIAQWIEELRPKNIVYVSCHSQTMFRDLKTIKNDYELKELHLLDLFPSTFHFEGLSILKSI